MLKLTIKDVLKQKPFGMIGIISGISLGILYYFLTLEMALTHMATEMELLPMYMTTSITLTVIVAVLAGINIALVAYNIKTQRNKNIKNGTSAILGGALTAFTPGCPAIEDATQQLKKDRNIGNGILVKDKTGKMEVNDGKNEKRISRSRIGRITNLYNKVFQTRGG